MVALAKILRRASESLHDLTSTCHEHSRSDTAMSLDAELLEWRLLLNPVFNLDEAGLKEQESVTKRKIMLKLRWSTTLLSI